MAKAVDIYGSVQDASFQAQINRSIFVGRATPGLFAAWHAR